MRLYLKELRIERNLSQDSVSKSIGISRAHYSRIEAGKRQIKMTIEMAQKLAEVFKVSVDCILKHEE